MVRTRYGADNFLRRHVFINSDHCVAQGIVVNIFVPKDRCMNCKRLLGWNTFAEKVWPRYAADHGNAECSFVDENGDRHGVPQTTGSSDDG